MEIRTKVYITLATFLIIIVGILFGVEKIKNYNFSDDVQFLKERVIHSNDKDIYNDIYSSEIERRNVKRISDLTEISQLLRFFKKEKGYFPNSTAVSGSLTQTGIFSAVSQLNPLVPEYTNLIYKDPLNNSINNYTYIYKNNNFVLFAHIESDDKNITRRYYCIDSYSKELTIVDKNPSFNFRCE